MNMVKRQLEIGTTFSKDIGMKFGEDRYAFHHIEKGLIKKSSPLNINPLVIQPVTYGDKVSKEYFSRVRNIWSSEFPNFNKDTAHNKFAVFIITATIEIIDYTINKIRHRYKKASHNDR